MKRPRKHAALIKEWADGAEIEYFSGTSGWQPVSNPEWYADCLYRVAPLPPPVRLVFDGLSNKLKECTLL